MDDPGELVSEEERCSAINPEDCANQVDELYQVVIIR
jgi:hypothetical protein